MDIIIVLEHRIVLSDKLILWPVILTQSRCLSNYISGSYGTTISKSKMDMLALSTIASADAIDDLRIRITVTIVWVGYESDLPIGVGIMW